MADLANILIVLGVATLMTTYLSIVRTFVNESDAATKKLNRRDSSGQPETAWSPKAA